ncbi:hypothetical protein HY969_02210 [Candidatus Kaiserbacteria bacterium]|nr:hypothetical protein [Candidatus Kaiserbacteria bacterium]
MSTNAIIGLVVAVAVVGAAVWYYSNNSSGSMMQGDNAQQVQQNGNTNTNTGSGTLASLFAMNGSYKCTVSSQVENSETDGVVYVSNGSVRGDFTSTVSAAGGEAVAAHMIKTGNDVYVWSDMMPQGIKMSASTMMSGSGSSANSAAFDPNVSVNYDCQPVAANANLFVAPANVQFMVL